MEAEQGAALLLILSCAENQGPFPRACGAALSTVLCHLGGWFHCSEWPQAWCRALSGVPSTSVGGVPISVLAELHLGRSFSAAAVRSA